MEWTNPLSGRAVDERGLSTGQQDRSRERDLSGANRHEVWYVASASNIVGAGSTAICSEALTRPHFPLPEGEGRERGEGFATVQMKA